MAQEITVKKILTLLQSEYPNSFSNMDERTMALKVNLWEQEFAGDDLELVYAAVRLYMKSPEKFAPNIGQIRDKMRMLTEKAELPEQQAWAMVSKACANGIYGYKKEFEKLPPEIQRVVGVPEQLREWAKMDSQTVESVVASNFMRNYRTQQSREHDLAMIPAEVRERLNGFADSFKMIGGGTDGN